MTIFVSIMIRDIIVRHPVIGANGSVPFSLLYVRASFGDVVLSPVE